MRQIALRAYYRENGIRVCRHELHQFSLISTEGNEGNEERRRQREPIVWKMLYAAGWKGCDAGNLGYVKVTQSRVSPSQTRVRLKLSGSGERTNEKRQRAAAVQNLAEFFTRPYGAIASWSAAVLCRLFGEPPKCPTLLIAPQDATAIDNGLSVCLNPRPFWLLTFDSRSRNLGVGQW